MEAVREAERALVAVRGAGQRLVGPEALYPEAKRVTLPSAAAHWVECSAQRVAAILSTSAASPLGSEKNGECEVGSENTRSRGQSCTISA